MGGWECLLLHTHNIPQDRIHGPLECGELSVPLTVPNYAQYSLKVWHVHKACEDFWSRGLASSAYFAT